MHIDPTISLGMIVHLTVILIGGTSAWFSIVRRMDRHEFKLDMMWREFKKEHDLNGMNSQK